MPHRYMSCAQLLWQIRSRPTKPVLEPKAGRAVQHSQRAYAPSTFSGTHSRLTPQLSPPPIQQVREHLVARPASYPMHLTHTSRQPEPLLYHHQQSTDGARRGPVRRDPLGPPPLNPHVPLTHTSVQNLEEAHEEDLSVVRTEAAGVIKSLMDENARLKLAMALGPAAGPAGAGPGDGALGPGGVRGGSAGALRPTGSGGGVGLGPLPFGAGAGVQFSLKAMGGGVVGSSGGSSPGGMARASPVRVGSFGSNHGGGMGVNSPGGGGGNGLVLPQIPQSRNGSRSGQRR